MKKWIALSALVFAACGSESSSSDASADSGANTSDASGSGGATDTESGTGGESDAGTGSDTSGGADVSIVEGDCPAALFSAGEAHASNAGYPAPMVNAYCEGDMLFVESNGIIDYEFVAMTPNDLAAQDYLWEIPLTPTWLDEPQDIPLLGTAAVAINGLPIYGPNEGEFPDPFGDPVYNSIVDECLGHTAQQGDYHYHALLVDCLTTDNAAGQPSPIIAYSFDGYPIYGPRGCVDEACTEVVEFRSGWEQTGDPTTYAWDNNTFVGSDDPTVLDRCNGRIGPDGTYRYHATSTFPYILGCYHGATDGGATGGGGEGGGGMTACSTDADCAGACFDGAAGCVCIESPMDGNICVPSCETDEDCDDGFECGGREGNVCVPVGGPDGGGRP